MGGIKCDGTSRNLTITRALQTFGHLGTQYWNQQPSIGGELPYGAGSPRESYVQGTLD